MDTDIRQKIIEGKLTRPRVEHILCETRKKLAALEAEGPRNWPDMYSTALGALQARVDTGAKVLQIMDEMSDRSC